MQILFSVKILIKSSNPLTIETSSACWYRARASCGKFGSSILAALSNDAAPDSGDPCCWYKLQALSAKLRMEEKSLSSLQTSIAWSMALAEWKSDRFCLWQSAHFNKLSLHSERLFAFRKHIADGKGVEIFCENCNLTSFFAIRAHLLCCIHLPHCQSLAGVSTSTDLFSSCGECNLVNENLKIDNRGRRRLFSSNLYQTYCFSACWMCSWASWSFEDIVALKLLNSYLLNGV